MVVPGTVLRHSSVKANNDSRTTLAIIAILEKPAMKYEKAVK